MFKVGDWVRYKDTLDIFQIKKDTQAFMIENNEDIYEVCELWNPQVGEWCVVPSTCGRRDHSAYIIQYNDEMHKGLLVEPFRGELPSFFQHLT